MSDKCNVTIVISDVTELSDVNFARVVGHASNSMGLCGLQLDGVRTRVNSYTRPIEMRFSRGGGGTQEVPGPDEATPQFTAQATICAINEAGLVQ